MKERNIFFTIKLLKNIIGVYFDTFFVLYFFQVANYEVIPLAKYYLALYLFIGIGFFLIRRAMKMNIKVPYFRIGIALQAIYIASIMILKENIIDYVILVGIIKGMADGFYHFPANLLSSEKVSNEERQKFDGLVSVINKIVAIVVPLILGVALTYFSYVDLGKIFFMLFIVMFVLTFFLKDEEYKIKKFDMKGFKNVLKKNSTIRYSILIPFLSGLTYSSGVMGLIMTLSKINNFKTNLNLGYVDSVCAVLSLIVCTLFAWKIKKKNYKILLAISGVGSLIATSLFALASSRTVLIIYLVARYSFILLINLISDVVVVNLSNCKELKKTYKPEFYLTRDVIFSISRCLGYIVLFIICLTVGVKYINYLMIICGISLLLEAIIVGTISDQAK